MRVHFFAIPSLLALVGCVNVWHVENYFDQRAYQHEDAASLRDDLDQTMRFLPTIGLKQLEEVKNSDPATEAVFIRDMGDHFHVTVKVRGLAQVNSPGWTLSVRVDSYNIGEEGAIAAGKAVLKEIDEWHERGVHSAVFTPQPFVPTTQ
jgi:hypothetical protein